ncbi:hypothetical protein ACOMHN_022109 [Nucella lapillus]
MDSTARVLPKDKPQHITKANVIYPFGHNDDYDDDDNDDDDDDMKDEENSGMEVNDDNDVGGLDDNEDESPCTNIDDEPFKENGVYGVLLAPKGTLRIRCMVDHVRGATDFIGDGSCDVTEVEKEDDVIVSGDTLLADLVQVALSHMGYDLDSVIGATGAIQLKKWKWKPLPFDVITDDKTATVDEVLGNDVEFVLRLRVPMKIDQDQEADWRDSSVRQAVLSLLKHHSQSALAKLSPLSQSTISTIANKHYKNRLSDKKCKAFGRWYSSYVGDIAKDFVTKTPHQQSPVTKTTFHPVSELPLLRSWFQTYPNPSNSRFNMFARILNSSQVRLHRPKISPKKIKIWWRNERQRTKDQQGGVSAARRKRTTKDKTSSSRAVTVKDKPTSSRTSMVRPGQCKGRCVPVQKSSKTFSRALKSVPGKATKTMVGGGQGFFPRKDVAVQHALSRLGSRIEDQGALPELPCISSSTDRTPSTEKLPALVPGSSSPEAEELPQQGSSFPSHPSLPQTPAHLAKNMYKRVRKNPDMTFTLQGQGHAFLPVQPPSTWQSSFMSWSGHRKRVQDRAAAAVSSESAFLLPAWQQYLPFVVPYQDRSRSESEQEVISSSSGCGFEEVERYKYSQDLPFGLPSAHF